MSVSEPPESPAPAPAPTEGEEELTTTGRIVSSKFEWAVVLFSTRFPTLGNAGAEAITAGATAVISHALAIYKRVGRCVYTKWLVLGPSFVKLT